MNCEYKRILYEFIFIILFLTIPVLDSILIVGRDRESSLNYEVMCHDYPDKCWIIQKGVQK